MYRSRPGRRSARRLPTTLTAAEAEALVAQIGTGRSATALRNRAMLAVMLGAGLRVSEVVALRPADVDWQDGLLRVNDGKGGRDRVVPIDSATQASLEAWAERRRALGHTGRQALFGRLRTRGPRGSVPAGGKLSTRAVQLLVRRLAEQAQIDRPVSPHTLRHTYATRMLDHGLTIREVQELLGHSDVSTTMVYTHVSPARLRERIQGPSAEGAIRARMAELQAQLDALSAQLPTLLGKNGP